MSSGTVEAVEVQTAGGWPAIGIHAVPYDAVDPGSLPALLQHADRLPEHIVHRQPHRPVLGQLIGDLRARVEGVGVVLEQVETPRHGRAIAAYFEQLRDKQLYTTHFVAQQEGVGIGVKIAKSTTQKKKTTPKEKKRRKKRTMGKRSWTTKRLMAWKNFEGWWQETRDW